MRCDLAVVRAEDHTRDAAAHRRARGPALAAEGAAELLLHDLARVVVDMIESV